MRAIFAIKSRERERAREREREKEKEKERKSERERKRTKQGAGKRERKRRREKARERARVAEASGASETEFMSIIEQPSMLFRRVGREVAREDSRFKMHATWPASTPSLSEESVQQHGVCVQHTHESVKHAEKSVRPSLQEARNMASIDPLHPKCEHGAYKTVRARFWPWRSCKSP